MNSRNRGRPSGLPRGAQPLEALLNGLGTNAALGALGNYHGFGGGGVNTGDRRQIVGGGSSGRPIGQRPQTAGATRSSSSGGGLSGLGREGLSQKRIESTRGGQYICGKTIGQGAYAVLFIMGICTLYLLIFSL